MPLQRQRHLLHVQDGPVQLGRHGDHLDETADHLRSRVLAPLLVQDSVVVVVVVVVGGGGHVKGDKDDDDHDDDDDDDL